VHGNLEPPPDLVLRDAEVHGVVADVLVRDGVIASVGRSAPPADTVIDCGGAALVPGLHDHHCHLLAAAAAADSAACGPPAVRNRTELHRALSGPAGADGWLRGVGYDESVAGDIDRWVLDQLGPAVPTRVQHRSGALWVLNSAGLAALALGIEDEPGGTYPDGVERDAAGRLTGRLWRVDRWLRDRLPFRAAPDLAGLSRTLARYGITGVTDATPDLDAAAIALLTGGELQQRLCLLGAPGPVAGALTGPFKIVVMDHALPGWDELAARVRAVRPRPVAVHSVSRESLILILAVLREVGAVPGDRIEHAAVVPPESVPVIAELGLAVVTQPAFIAERGADYLDRVAPDDLGDLWPWRRFDQAGVPVACSSDAPYASWDPWAAIAAAAGRLTADGRLVAPDERVDAARALAAYCGAPLDPGGAPRRIARGEVADIAVLDRPWRRVIGEPAAVRVRATVIGGRVAFAE
jgi:predicted amidohydrolase YtcJ